LLPEWGSWHLKPQRVHSMTGPAIRLRRRIKPDLLSEMFMNDTHVPLKTSHHFYSLLRIN
jgi:hypothetical protein